MKDKKLAVFLSFNTTFGLRNLAVTKGEEMIHTNLNTTYYINPAYLSFVENSGYGANLIQVSASSSCYIRVFISGVIGYDADGNYRKWKLTAYNNKFPNDGKFYIYARLEREGASALIVYSKSLLEVDGSSTDGTVASESYYFIRIGEVSATDGTSIREITYDTGRLESDQVKAEGTEINEMWELDKNSTPWLIRAKHWLSSFTLKGFLTFMDGFIFHKGEDEKMIEDIKRSVDISPEGPFDDMSLPTTLAVRKMNDDIYLSKIKDDRTPHHIEIAGGLTTTEAESLDYAEGVEKAGWASKKNFDEEWYYETDNLIARILANVYDLMVQNHAVFKKSLSSEEFISGFVGGKGWAIRLKDYLNAAGVIEKRSVAEFDDLIVRGTMRVFEFIVSQMLGENDNRIFTGMMEVDHYDPTDGKIYMNTDGGKLYNPFRKDDIIIVQQYNGMPSEDNNYYVVKQYEFLVTEVGVGNLSDKEDRLDWVKFTNFSTPMEGTTEEVITKGDTLVRIDNLTDARRKGIVQVMAVGEDTPYMDFIYGAKTDPDNALKGRLGNLGGIYHPLFGWLKEFGAYLANLYAVGEFRIAHTGEDVADAIEITRGAFRTNYRQTTYDLTEEDDYFTNSAMINNCEGWELGEDDTSFFSVGDDLQFFNYELYGSENSFAGMAEYHDRNMLRLSLSSVKQKNVLIDKPQTHRVHTGNVDNGDGTYTRTYEDVLDTLYLSVRLFVEKGGNVKFGFMDEQGRFYENKFYVSKDVEAQEDAYEFKVSGQWDSRGDFCIVSEGDIYVDRLSLTDKPLENFMITTSTAIEQDASRVALIGKRVSGVEGSVTNLGVELNAAEERITLYINKEIDGVEGSISQLNLEVGSVTAKVATAQGSADRAQAAADAVEVLANSALSMANTANDKATANASALSVQANGIAALSARFNSDGTLKNTSGLVTTADYASLFSTEVTKQGVAKTSSLSLYVAKSEWGDLVSTIRLSADQINLEGAVTYSMLAPSMKSTLDGKATNSALQEAQKNLTNSISSLNTTVSTLQTDLNKKASIDSLNEKVTELNNALKGKANTDLANAVLSGSTLILNGFIRTDFIDVENLVAKKVVTKPDRYNTTITIADGTLHIKNTDGVSLASLRTQETCGGLSLWDTAGGFVHLAPKSSVFELPNGKKVSVNETYGIQLSGGASIAGFRLGNVQTYMGGADFCIYSGHATDLPDASGNEGKVIWVYCTRECTIRGDIKNADGGSASSVTAKGMNFFISDGSYWYRGYCQ